MSNRMASLLVVVCMICGLFTSTISVAANSTADYTQAIEMVEAFGVYSPSEKTGDISRGEFAKIISGIINYNDAIPPVDGQFTDVTAENDYSGAVYNLLQRGIISGYTEDTFRPDAPILYEQALKIILSSAGYDKYVEAKRGKYPEAYLILASERKLNKNLTKKVGETLNANEMAQLIANALECSIFKQTVFGGTENYEVYENVTLMSEYMKIKKIEGIVKDNSITSLTGETKVGNGFVVIGSNEYNAAGTNVSDLLGYRVEAFVDESSGSNKKVIYARKADNVDDLVVKADRLLTDSSEFSVTNIPYNDVYNRKKSVKIALEADFIYNGKAYPDLRVDSLKLSDGELVLIDNNRDNVFEIVFVNAPRVMVVSAINTEYEAIYDKRRSDPLLLKDADIVSIVKEGKHISMTGIKEWDVLMAYKSVDGKVINIVVTSEKVTGAVKELSSEEQVININNEYYRIKDTSILNSLDLGQEYEFCIDTQMNIVAVKEINIDTDNIAYFIKAAKNTKGLKNNVQVKMYTIKGSHVVYDCSKKVSVDGDKTKTTDEVESYLNTNAANGLISYKINKEGQISEITLPYEGTELPAGKEGTLHMYYEQGATDMIYSMAQRTLDGKIMMSPNVHVLQIPSGEGAEDDQYSANGIGYFGNQSAYKNFKVYNIGAEDARADFFVHFADATPQYGGGTYPIVVSKIKHIINSDGEDRECLYGYDYRGEIEYIAKNDNLFTAAGVKPGDIVRCPINLLGEVTEVRRVYDGENKNILSAEDVVGGFGFSSYRAYVGNVFYRYDTLLGLTTSAITASNENTVKTDLRLYDIATSKIYVFDEQNGKPEVKLATVESLCDYQRAGQNYSTVYIHDTEAVPKMVVVYQRNISE